MLFLTSAIALDFDRLTPLRHLACATFRGLLGHVLAATDPDAVGRFFKPGHAGAELCPYIFQPLHTREIMATRLAVRLITFDPAGECMARFLNALPACVGGAFGESGAKIAAVQHTPVVRLERDSTDDGFYDGAVVRVNLRTPTRLTLHTQPVKPDNFSLPVFVTAGLRRLGDLQQAFGPLHAAPATDLLQILGNAHLGLSRLRWADPRRRSTTQDTDISLGGLVGSFDVHHATRKLWDLLVALAATNVGKKTSCGCGAIACRILM